MTLTALALNCTLKPGKEDSSTDKLLKELLSELGKYEVSGEVVRVADLDIKPGVTSDKGVGDAWPALRKRVLAADILIIGTPIWLGQPSSVASAYSNAWTPFSMKPTRKSACRHSARSASWQSSAMRMGPITVTPRFIRL